jgi:hypothetical protein
MSLRFPIALALALGISAGSAIAQNQALRKSDPVAELLTKLRKPVNLDRNEGLSLNDLLTQLGDKCGVTALIDESAFKTRDDLANPGKQMIKVPLIRGMALTSALPHILGQIDATFLVCKDHIEIVPITFAAKETKNVASSEDDTPVRLAQPLVSMIFKEKPLNEAIAELAEEYNLTVIVSPQSGDARTGFVTARLLNTPADKALELLALQCDLRIVRKANTFLITSRDHANDLFNERMEHERAKIDLEKFRTAPPAPPQPTQPTQFQIPVLPITPVPVTNPAPAPNPNPPPPPKQP